VRPVCHQHDVAHPFGPADRRLGLGEKGEVDEQDRVPGVVQYPRDLFGMQPRIDRMTDGADTGDGVEDFQVPVRTARERRHPIARTHPERPQRIGELPDALGRPSVTAAMDRLSGRVRDDFAITMHGGRMLQQSGDQQRPLHHRPLHQALLVIGPRAALVLVSRGGDGSRPAAEQSDPSRFFMEGEKPRTCRL
jgi:hypothetical protein